MNLALINAFIIYAIGLLILPNLRAGSRLRRLLQLAYAPAIRLGLWHRWSMYSPEVPRATELALTGVRFEDGRFEVVPIEGFDDGRSFGGALGLRFIAFQWALCSPITDYMKPALCRRARRRFDAEHGSGAAFRSRPIAVEIVEYLFDSPPLGSYEQGTSPRIRTLWSQAWDASP